MQIIKRDRKKEKYRKSLFVVPNVIVPYEPAVQDENKMAVIDLVVFVIVDIVSVCFVVVIIINITIMIVLFTPFFVIIVVVCLTA